MKKYQKPLLTVETLLADTAIAFAFDIVVSGEGDKIYDDDVATVFDDE